MPLPSPGAPATTATTWALLAEPFDRDSIRWRIDGKPVARDGQYVARFVAYLSANDVRRRLDQVAAGEWDLTLELLPIPIEDDTSPRYSFLARIQVAGVIRENVGSGATVKSAASDAFKRAATRFGIGNELYDLGTTWVRVDSDGKYARPLEDPAVASVRARAESAQHTFVVSKTAESEIAAEATAPSGPRCPKCKSLLFDNRPTKRNPRAPDFKCTDRTCGMVIWPGMSLAELTEVPSTEIGSSA